MPRHKAISVRHLVNKAYPANMVGYIHCHLNSYQVPDKDGDGIPDMANPIKRPSHADIVTFLEILAHAHDNGTALEEVYGSTYSSAGDYTLKFTGNIMDVLNNLDDLIARKYDKTLKEDYEEYFDDFNNDNKALLHFLKDEIGIDGIRLFRIKNNGTIKEKFLDDNGGVDTESC